MLLLLVSLASPAFADDASETTADSLEWYSRLDTSSPRDVSDPSWLMDDRTGFSGRSYDNAASGDAPSDAHNMAGRIFEGLRSVGEGANSGDAATAARSVACSAFMEQLRNRATLPQLGMEQNDDGVQAGALVGKAKGFVVGQGEAAGYSALSAFCMGQTEGGIGMDGDGLKSAGLNGIVGAGVGMLKGSGFSMFDQLQVETGIEDGDIVWTARTTAPVWKDQAERNFVLTQLGYSHRNNDDDADEDDLVADDTINSGLVLRHLSEDETYYYGGNMFFDHATARNHNRASVGVEARTSQLGIGANRYIPLSGWKSVDQVYEERALAGWDVEVRGQIPQLPSWLAYTKGYQWDEVENETPEIFGYEAGLEYSPIRAITVSAGVQDENDESPALEALLRLNLRFNEPLADQFKTVQALDSVKNRIYEPVRREDTIRVGRRHKDTAQATVLESVGANTVQSATGITALRAGDTVFFPATINVANTVGAIGRIRFADSAILTAGQNTSVRIEPTLITLITGTIQYVSGGVTRNVAVPGGTIVLHGTDIDVSSNGSTSVVRVRDGNVTVTGDGGGTTNLAPMEAAQVSGSVSTPVPQGSATYNAHTEQVATDLDRVGSPVTEDKAAPYPYEAPRLVTAATATGQNIVIGQRFSKAVAASGGPVRLRLTINGLTRYANLSGGSGTTNLAFSYTLASGDIGASSVVVESIETNGGTLRGDGKDAVSTIAPVTLNLGGTVGSGDTTAPSGYTVAFNIDPVTAANHTAISFGFAGAEIGADYDYTITSSGGAGSVTGSGTIATATDTVSAIDVSSLPDGTLTVSATLTDSSNNTGTAATDTAVKDASGPAAYTVAFTTDPVTTGNQTTAAFDLTGGEVGADYDYTITSSGGGTPITASGTVASAPQSFSNLDVTSLPDGTLTVSITLTDTLGNAGSPATDTVVKDTAGPTGYAVAFTTDPINNANKAAVAFEITGAQVGAGYSYTITSSGGAGSVTASGTIATATQSVTPVDVTSLPDGTLTVSLTLTATNGNVGAAVTDTVLKDVVAPTIVSVTAPANGTYEP